MTKLEKLKREAKSSAEWRGHFLGRFKRDSFWKNCAFAKCDYCGLGVCVDPRPQPNGIDISGEAIVLDCRA